MAGPYQVKKVMREGADEWDSDGPKWPAPARWNVGKKMKKKDSDGPKWPAPVGKIKAGGAVKWNSDGPKWPAPVHVRGKNGD